MSTPLSLELVQAEFQTWRTNKANPKSRIPVQLKQRAVELCESYPNAKIISALGINSTMLKRWSKQPPDFSDPLKSAVEFIALPVEETPSHDKSESLRLTLEQPNGNRWRLQGNVTSSQLNVFVAALSALSGVSQ